MASKQLARTHNTPNSSAVTTCDSSDGLGDNNCVVCFKNFEIYSIGECDHICCFECSTRMRVLCRQNECPICRKDLAKVIFTTKVQPYQELDAQNRAGLYDKKYRICFSNLKIQKAFYELLDNSCPKCDKHHFTSFAQLKEHVRKEHELYYCDICTDNLNIFSKERRCYTRQELALHRRKGDPDNKSHRGHPLCEYCDNRYLDNDELFRHLRRQHYFCHFCDADGANQFYADYDSLRDHFRSEHFFCEEDDCIHEKFTNIFRTEIDLRAHKATVHGKNLSRTAAKQTRTLEVEFTYTPRNRNNNNHNNQEGQPSRRNAPRNAQPDIQMEFESMNSEPVMTQKPAKIIDAQNPEEFPSLGGSSTSSVTFGRPANVSIRHSYGPSGLARTKENFPALSSGSHSKDSGVNKSLSSKPSTSVILKNSSKNGQNKNKGGDAMVIHLSNRPNFVQKEKVKDKEFPALPGHSRNNKFLDLDEDCVPSTLPSTLVNVVSAKHRNLVDDYVSVGPNTSAKINLLQTDNATTRKPVKSEPVPSLNNFPSLGASSALKNPQWITTKTTQQSNNTKDNNIKKTKVAPAPLVDYENNFTTLTSSIAKMRTSNNTNISSNNTNKNNNDKSTKDKNEQLQKKDKRINNKSNDRKDNVTEHKKDKNSIKNNYYNNFTDFIEYDEFTGPSTPTTTLQYEKIKITSNNDQPKQNISNKNDTNTQKGGITFSENSFPVLGMTNGAYATGPPPGFSRNPAPPPGFSNVKLNSIARNTNNLTFTSSSGESFDILPAQHGFLAPPNATKRNEELFSKFKKSLNNDANAIEEFKLISKMFRDGSYKSLPYYEHCKSALKDKFEDIFPELLVLLPDISKQQELYLVHSQQIKNPPIKGPNNNNNNNKRKPKFRKLEVCATCKQVLLTNDLPAHVQSHALENDFPTLDREDEDLTSAWKK